MPHGVSTYVVRAAKCSSSFTDLVSDLTSKLSNPKTRYSKEALAQLRELCLYIAPEQDLGQSSILKLFLETAVEAGDGDNDRKVARTCYYLLTDIIQSTSQRQTHSLTPQLLEHLIIETREQAVGSARTSLQWRTIGRIGNAPSMSVNEDSELAKKAYSVVVSKLTSLKFPERKKSFLGQKKANMEFENEIHLWISVFSAMRRCSEAPPASAVMPNILIACASPQDTLARHAFALLRKVAEASPPETSVLLIPKLRDGAFIERAWSDLFMASNLMYACRALMIAPAAAGSTVDDTLSMLCTMLANSRLEIQLEAARVLLETPQIWSFSPSSTEKAPLDPIPVLIVRLLVPLLTKIAAQFRDTANACYTTYCPASSAGIHYSSAQSSSTEGLSPLAVSSVCKACIRLGRYMLFRPAESQTGSSNTNTSASGFDVFEFSASPSSKAGGFASRTFSADSAIEASLLQLLDALRACIDAIEVADAAAVSASLSRTNTNNNLQDILYTTSISSTPIEGIHADVNPPPFASGSETIPIALSVDGGTRALLLAAFGWTIPTADMDRNTSKAANLWDYLREKCTSSLHYLTEDQAEQLIRHLVGRLREEDDTICTPSMPLLTSVCLQIAEASSRLHQSSHILKQLWELYAVEFSQKFPAVNAALLASLVRCLDGTYCSDTSTPTDAGSLCVGSTVGTLRSNAASSRTKEEAILHTMSPQKSLYNLQLHACWILGEYNYLWIDQSALSFAYCFDGVAYDEVKTDGCPDSPFIPAIVAIMSRLMRCLWLEAGPIQCVAAAALYKLAIGSPPTSGLYRYIREQFYTCSAAAAGLVTSESACCKHPWTQSSSEMMRLIAIGHDASKVSADPTFIRAVNRGGPFAADLGELQRCLSAFLLAMDSASHAPSGATGEGGSSSSNTTSAPPALTVDLLGDAASAPAPPQTHETSSVTVSRNKLDFLNGLIALK